VDALAMRRDQIDSLPLIVDGGGSVLLSTGDLNLDVRAGPRVGIARRLSCSHDLEFEFFGIDGWTSSTAVTTPGAFLPLPSGLVGTSPINVAYGSELYSTELNWRYAWGCHLKTLLGFRWFELHEDMLFRDALSPPALLVGDVDNHLYGFQLGLEAVVLRVSRLEIECGLKCGIYHNDVDLAGASPQAAQQVLLGADHTAFCGELMVGVNYCLTSRLALRAGYQVMWIEGVALLPEQLDNFDPATGGIVDLGGSPLYHGGFVGLQCLW
jgi:hypothetical protein